VIGEALVVTVVPEVTDDYDRRQRGRLFFDEEETWGGLRYRMNLRLCDELPPEGHVSASHCIAFEDDRVVLAKHVDREWTIPGGRLEPGETPLACLIREAAEEAGLVIADARVVAHNRIELLDDAPEDWPYPFPSYQVFYVARVVELGEITALDECTEARLFTIDEALGAPGWPQQHPEFAAALLSLRP
jgi:8-oxo-dGTP diphosphatase